jgi:hypothetical protein
MGTTLCCPSTWLVYLAFLGVIAHRRRNRFWMGLGQVNPTLLRRCAGMILAPRGGGGLGDHDQSEDNSLSSTNSGRLLPLWVFLALSAALSWTVWFWPISHRLAFRIAFHGWRSTWPLYNIKLLIGNALPGLLALIWASVPWAWTLTKPVREDS